MIYLYICTTSCISIRLPSFCYVIFVPTIDRRSGLPNGYCLYGDNAYVNKTYMSVPFPKTSSGPRDAYNYYQSQVQINIECAFGVLTNQWCLLKSPLSAKNPINRINALMSCLCKIHNFCIDNGNAKPQHCYKHDALMLMDLINDLDSENPHPLGLLGVMSILQTFQKADVEQIRDHKD